MTGYTNIAEAVRLMRARRGDTESIEAKACGGGLSKDVWESVSAFANSHGGILILGLDERENFVPAKGFDADRVLDQFVSGIGDGGLPGSRLSNPPHYDVIREEVDGSTVVVIKITELDMRLKPCYITARGVNGGSYKRVDDKDIRLSPSEVYELANALVISDADRAFVQDAEPEDFDPEKVERLIASEIAKESRAIRGASTRQQQLQRLGAMDRQGRPTLAGMLALGYYPQQFFPSLFVDVAVHPGNAKAADGGGVRFLDREICEGSIDECIGSALRAVARNIRTISVVKGLGRADVREVPEEVLREALVNAIVHREYDAAFTGQPISVDIYENRLEITSPGGLWGGKTVENIADGTSRCRNAALMRLVRSLPGVAESQIMAEGQGSGVPMMMHEMERNGLTPPSYKAGVDFVKVIFRRNGVGFAAAREERGAYGGLDDEIVAALSGGMPLKAQEIALATGANINSVRRHLRNLLEAGAVRATAPKTDRNRRYLLAEPPDKM